MPKKLDVPELNYRQMSEELDKILDSLQGANIDIDEAVKYYERGMALVKKLENYLHGAENRISTIKKQFGDKTT